MDKQLYLFFDTETTGLPKNYDAPSNDLRNWPRLVQISWIVSDCNGIVISKNNHIIKPRGFEIPENVAKLHGITTERALEIGERIEDVLHLFWKDVQNASYIIGHNVDFDKKIVESEFYRMGENHVFLFKHSICTKLASTDYCKIPSPGFPQFKWPKLSELYYILFGKNIDDAHNSEADVQATFECFWELKELGVISGLGVDGGIIPSADEYTSDNRIQFTTFAFNAADYDFGESTDQGRFWERLLVHDWRLFAEDSDSQILVFHNEPYLQAHLVKNGIGIAGRFALKEYNSIILSFGDESYYLHCVFYNQDIIIFRFDQSCNHILLSRKDFEFHSFEELRSYLINERNRIILMRDEKRKRKEIEFQNHVKALIDDIIRTDVETSDQREISIKRKFKELTSILGKEETAKYQKYVDRVIKDNTDRKEREAEERQRQKETRILKIAVYAVFILHICIWCFALFFHLTEKWKVCSNLLSWSFIISSLGIIFSLGVPALLMHYFRKTNAIILYILFILVSSMTIFLGYVYDGDWQLFRNCFWNDSGKEYRYSEDEFSSILGDNYLSKTEYHLFESKVKNLIKQRIDSSVNLQNLNEFLRDNSSGFYVKEAKEQLNLAANKLCSQAKTLGDWQYLIDNAPQKFKTVAEKNYEYLDSYVWEYEDLAYENAKSLNTMEAYDKYLSGNFNNNNHRLEIEKSRSELVKFIEMNRKVIESIKTKHSQ